MEAEAAGGQWRNQHHAVPFVSSWSSRPSLGRATVWCLDRVTLITLPNTFWPFRWLIAAGSEHKYERGLQTVLQCAAEVNHSRASVVSWA